MHRLMGYQDFRSGFHNEMTSLAELTDPRREPNLNLEGFIVLSKVQKCDLSLGP